MKRTPLKRKTPLRPSKITAEQRRAWNDDPSPVGTDSARAEWHRPVGKVKKYNGKINSTVKKQIDRRCRGICEMPGCNAKATQHHHRKLQAQGGKHTASNIVKLCHECHHVKIHRNTGWAYRWGWLVKSFEDPAAIPWGVERPY